jgi:hypothetical protein
VQSGGKKVESRGKLKVSPEFQKFRGTFKTTQEDRIELPREKLNFQRIVARKLKSSAIAMFSRRSRSSAANEVGGRKIKTSAGSSDLSLKIQKFSCKSETSHTSTDVPGLRRISSDSVEFPADDLDFQRHVRNAADSSSNSAERGDFQQNI